MLVAQEMYVIYKKAAETLDVETATFAKSPFFDQTVQNSGITGPPALKKCQSYYTAPKRSYLPGVCKHLLLSSSSFKIPEKKTGQGNASQDPLLCSSPDSAWQTHTEKETSLL